MTISPPRKRPPMLSLRQPAAIDPLGIAADKNTNARHGADR